MAKRPFYGRGRSRSDARPASLENSPSRPVRSARTTSLRRERAAVARARGMIRSVQEEVAAILIAGIRGDARQHRAVDAGRGLKLAAKGGLHDTVAGRTSARTERPINLDRRRHVAVLPNPEGNR